MSGDPLSDGGLAALARADARARAAIGDLFLSDDARLADRVRTAAAATLRACVDAIEEALRRDATRLLTEAGHGAAADTMRVPAGAAFRTLEAAGLLRDAALVEELVAEAARDWLEERLPVESDAGQHGLTVRLANDPDPSVGMAAVTFAEAQLRARSLLPLIQLPSALHRPLKWLVAATIRDGVAVAADKALSEATEALVGVEPPAGAALRLADAVRRRSGRVGPMLADALRDRSTTLFIAILARKADLDYGQTRMLLVEPTETMLWVALRSAGLNRGEMAAVGAMLAIADPRRDLDLLADTLDRVVALPSGSVEHALASLRLPSDFRRAVRALEAAR